MALDPFLVSGTEEGERAHTSSCEELDGEDGVDLANELVSDIDGSFGDRTAKLDDVSKRHDFESRPHMCSSRRNFAKEYHHLKVIWQVVFTVSRSAK